MQAQLNMTPQIYADPAMRPHLEKYYNKQYAPIHERIDQMEGQEPRTIKLRNADGTTSEGTELSAAQYRSAIPSFDKWLEMQQNFSSFDMAAQSESHIKHARKMLQNLEQHTPDTSSGVRTVFSDGNQIMAYINEDGGLVTHEGAHSLQRLKEQADRLNLTGEERISYLTEKGAEELSRRTENLQTTIYERGQSPTKREFSNTWYPHHNVDYSYDTALAEAQKHLETIESWHQQQMQNIYDMRAFLLQSMEEAQTQNAA